MRRVVLVLSLLLPLLCACGEGSETAAPGMPGCYYGAGGESPVLPSTLAECLELNEAQACTALSPAPGQPQTGCGVTPTPSPYVPATTPTPCVSPAGVDPVIASEFVCDGSGVVSRPCEDGSYERLFAASDPSQPTTEPDPPLGVLITATVPCASDADEGLSCPESGPDEVVDESECTAVPSSELDAAPLEPGLSAEPGTPPPADSVAAGAAEFADGAELTFFKGLTPAQALARIAPDGTVVAVRDARARAGTGERIELVEAVDLGTWTMVFEPHGISVDDPAALSHGTEVVHVAVHFEADAVFAHARAGRLVRSFDPVFNDGDGEGEGARLPGESRLGWDVQRGDDVTGSALELAWTITGVRVTGELLTATGGRVAVLRPAA